MTQQERAKLQAEEREREFQRWLAEMIQIDMDNKKQREKEVCERLYTYEGMTLVADDALLCPGDILVLEPGDTLLVSSRGVNINLTKGDLEKLLSADAVDKLFDVDKMNDKDFEKSLDEITSKIKEQYEYRDAYAYMQTDTGKAIAIFAKDAETLMPTGVIVRSGADFITAAGEALGPDTMQAIKDSVEHRDVTDAPLKECTYDEFNPESVNIKNQLEENVNPERENKTNKYEQLKELYAKNNYSSDSIDKTASATDKLSMIREAQDQRIQDTSTSEIESDDISPLSTSKAMRYMS